MNKKNKKSISKIAVITIAFNDIEGLKKTLDSVTSQTYIDTQFIVIDGGSTDGSHAFLEQNSHHIDKLLIEKDEGIYHAMNKGLELADSDWVIFMNAGDIFSSNDILLKLNAVLDGAIDVIYADWLYSGSNQVIKANFDRLNVRHQSLIYRKSLHSIYGNYLVGANVSISDYLFFLSIKHHNWKYFEEPISICDQGGVSSNPSHFYQRILSECLFGKRSRLSTSFILTFYPIYRFIKRSILRMG